MRRGRFNFIGLTAVAAGVIIIMSLVLPGKFWWFVLAAALICCGCWLMRCC